MNMSRKSDLVSNVTEDAEGFVALDLDWANTRY